MSSKGKGPRYQRQKPDNGAKTQQILAELNRKIGSFEAADDLPQAFMGRSAKALLHFTQQKWSAAAREFDKAAQLALDAGQSGPEAQCRLGQAMALENLPQKQAEAVTAYRQAATLFAQAGNLEAMVDARQRLAGLHASRGDFEQAALEMTATLEHFEEVDNPALVVAAYRSRAQFRLLQTNLVGEGVQLALADLEAAIRIAAENEDRQTVASLQNQRQTLQNYAAGGGNLEQLSTLLQEAVKAGNLDATTDIRLQQAQMLAGKGRYKQALEMAEAARQDALHGQDLGRYIRYLMACIIIAGIRDATNDRPGVIAILLTCKKTLENDLGQEVGQQINRLLDSLAERWGRDGLREALQTYRERMAAQ